ncbi:hypothetical protein ES708_17283 [subsurface metagenome]
MGLSCDPRETFVNLRRSFVGGVYCPARILCTMECLDSGSQVPKDIVGCTALACTGCIYRWSLPPGDRAGFDHAGSGKFGDFACFARTLFLLAGISRVALDGELVKARVSDAGDHAQPGGPVHG